ncbi:MAG: hypothetical protein HY514_04115, partial [Candidatus Aenigmarchaeota archaeon]|nr:hypothetical protein [Candidatus Aenigmarchaeota archaeon]
MPTRKEEVRVFTPLFKLNEAKFFLKKMVEAEKNLDEFPYYTSAFISATRSITWALEKEFSKNK